MIKKISFIGAGSMAEAVVSGIVHHKVIENENIWIMNKDNKERLKSLHEEYGVSTSTDRKEVIEGADIIVIATKPLDVAAALSNIKDYIKENQVIISVVAGVSTDVFVRNINKDVAVIRTMPNTSATIGHAATAICKGEFASNEHIEQARTLFEAIGTVSVVDEDDMHIVTGLSGSGPAYIYYLVEAMEKAAIDEGLDEKVAKQLISQTIIGAGKMLQIRKESPKILRENVTSPNGTTAAGLATLKNHHVQEAFVECVKSATRRSEELGEENK